MEQFIRNKRNDQFRSNIPIQSMSVSSNTNSLNPGYSRIVDNTKLLPMPQNNPANSIFTDQFRSMSVSSNNTSFLAPGCSRVVNNTKLLPMPQNHPPNSISTDQFRSNIPIKPMSVSSNNTSSLAPGCSRVVNSTKLLPMPQNNPPNSIFTVDPVQNKLNKHSSTTSASTSTANSEKRGTSTVNDNLPNTNSDMLLQVFGSTQMEKMFIFTGTVEKVIKWNKIFQNHFCYYEVIGCVISIQEGNIAQQKMMLFRDKKGPILQVIYYESTYIDIEDFYVGKTLTCVGKMIGQNVMNAITIRNTRETELENLERLCSICDQAVSHFLHV